MRRAERAGFGWPLPEDLDDSRLEATLYPGVKNVNTRVVDIEVPDWEDVYAEFKKKEVTLRLLWEELRERNPEAWGYSWYCEQFAQWKKKRRISMRQIHKAGEKLFVDFAGKTVPIFDRETGKATHCQIFVACWGASVDPLFDYQIVFCDYPFLWDIEEVRWVLPGRKVVVYISNVNLNQTSKVALLQNAFSVQVPKTLQGVHGSGLQKLTKKETATLMVTTLGEHYLQRGEFKKAAAAFELVLEFYPKAVYAMLKAGSAYYHLLEQKLQNPEFKKLPQQERQLARSYHDRNLYFFERAESLGWQEPPN